MRKGFWLILLLNICVLLAGCGIAEDKIVNISDRHSKPSVSLTFFGNKVEPGNVKAIETILNKYMQLHPEVQISYESLKGNEYFKILETRLRSGNGDDIFIIDHDRLLAFEEKGYLAELSDVQGMDALAPVALQQLQAEKGYFYMPTSISALGLFCNLDLLKKYNQTVPKDWQEFTASCAFFDEQGILPLVVNKDLSLATVILSGGWNKYYLNGQAEMLCGRINSGELQVGESLHRGVQMAQALCLYTDTEAALQSNKNSDDYKIFAKGQSPFMLTGAWNTGRLKKLRPDFAFGVYPYPLCGDGAILMLNIDTRMAVNAASPHLAEAKKFLSFFAQKENMELYAASQNSFSSLRGSSVLPDKEQQPLSEALRSGRIMLGSDDRIKVPIWSRAFSAGQAILRRQPLEKVDDILDAET